MKLKLNGVVLNNVFEYNVCETSMSFKLEKDTNLNQEQTDMLKDICPKFLFVWYDNEKAIYLNNIDINKVTIKHIK